MAERFEQLEEKHVEFIRDQHIFFIGTAGKEGFINVSPKGMDSFRIIDRTRVVWLNLTGSGNETAAHVLENGRMTVMFCSFKKQPLILRLYGKAKAVHPRDNEWAAFEALFPRYTGARQFFVLDLELVQTSCGYAVPFYELVGDRSTLSNWADKKGRSGVEEYWKQKNTKSLNDGETGILDDG